MNYLVIIFPKLFSFLILIVLGLTVSKLGIVTKDGMPTLSSLLIKIVLPCLTISLLHQQNTTFADLLFYHRIIVWQIGMYCVLALIGVLCARLAKLTYPVSNVHQGCMVGGNYSFVVIPMIMALFTANEGQQYIPICSTVDTLVVWTLGLALFTHGVPLRNASKLKSLAKRLINPILVTILGMLTLNSIGIELPGITIELCEEIGNISYSLGLVYVGCSIFYLKKGSLSALKSVSLIILTKLLIVPFLLYMVASHFIPETESIILMLIAGAPSMTTSCLIADQYCLDQDYAATAVFATTICCLLTIPLLFLGISLTSFSV